MVYVQDPDIVVSEFEIQSCYYFYFQINTCRDLKKKKKSKIYKFQKVAVYLVASDRKRYWCMSGKKGFLAPKRNSFSLSCDNFYWSDFFKKSRLLLVSTRARSAPGLTAGCLSS